MFLAVGVCAQPTWNQYMDANVYGRADRRCSRLEILCGRGENRLFTIGRARRPKPGDGLQIRFGVGADGMEGPNPSQEDAPITDAFNKAAPVVNTSLFLVALILFLL